MSPAKAPPAAGKQRLISVTLDEESIGRSNEDVEHEREVAIYDLLEQNTFKPVGHDGGAYALHLSINSNRLVFDIHNDGSHILMERLKDKVTVDLDTARRLFTLICVLHWKG